MANVVIRMQKTTVGFDEDFPDLLEPTSFVSITGASQIIRDITVDDVVSGAAAVAQEEAELQGWVFVATDPAQSLEEAAREAGLSVDSIRESGGTDLAIGSVSNGDFLQRSGSTLIGASSPGGVDFLDAIFFDHFVSSNIDTDEIAKHGWKRLQAGTGASLKFVAEVGHPGIASCELGTVAGGRCGLFLGSFANVDNFNVATGQNAISFEYLFKMTDSIATTDVERITMGLGDQWNAGAGIEHDEGVYVEFDPTLNAEFALVTVTGGTPTRTAGTTTLVIDTWYRVGLDITYPGGTPTAALSVNGAAEVTGQTANFPTVVSGTGIRGDAGSAPSTEAIALWDYAIMTQVTAKED